MKISYNWLASYIDIPESPEKLAEILTSTGLEVERIETVSTVKGGLRGLVVGEVKSCQRHPNADRLWLTTVDIGNESPASIVCGAPNVAAGQKVIVALPGATIYPPGKDPLEIRKSKIRGEISEGMICAEDEIGLGPRHDGIMVLDTKLHNGSPASACFPGISDAVFEIGLTPNRADAFSHIGVARDIKAVTKREIKWPDVSAFPTDRNNLSIEVTVENPDACPRYSYLSLANVKVAESPAWLKDRLTSIGLTPINNIVDITNFVCHELGQPLHAFDADRIAGKHVIVKTLPEGSKFVTLDGKTRELRGNDLMICDERGGLCIAGVFGGASSGITTETKNIFLESACFSPVVIRRTVLHHQLITDASFRFARGTDPNITVYALKRAALLICELAGGAVASGAGDVYPQIIERHVIEITDRSFNRLVGKEIPRSEVLRVLSRLDIASVQEEQDRFTVSVPPYRVDVRREADVVEEFLRIYGYNNIELDERFQTDFISGFPEKDSNKIKTALGLMLASNGFQEVWTNSLTDSRRQAKHKENLPGDPVEMINKLSEELGSLRQTLLFTMMDAAAYNINRKLATLRFYEFGKIYFHTSTGYQEEERLGLLLTGTLETENWQSKARDVNFFDLNQQVFQVLDRCGVSSVEKEGAGNGLFEVGVTLSRGNEVVGFMGRVGDKVARDSGIKQEIFYAELHTALLLKAANPKLVIQEIPRYPLVRRDLSLVLDKRVRFREVRELAMKTGKHLLEDLTLFDVYEGERIPEGKKAYALSFTLVDRTKTLTDEEIDSTMKALMDEFESRLGAVIRQ